MDARRIAAARLWAAHRYPYLATGLFAMQVVAAPNTGAFAVDAAWRLYVDPTVADGWTVEELGGMLVHHTGHLLRDHAARAEAFGIQREDAEQWTLSCDAEINDDLTGLTLPGEPVTPQTLGFEPGRFAEEYFRRIDQTDQHADCGSGADSHARDWDSDAAPGIAQNEAKLLRSQVASDVLQHARGKAAGTVPRGLRRWAQELLQPKVDWRKALAAEVRRGIADVAGRVDYSYRRPSRRAPVSPDVILPALRRPVPDIAIVVDTSGSMSERALGLALSEVDGILSGLGVRNERIRVLSCDAAVHRVQRVTSARRLELFGGGGTSMATAIEAASGLRPRPSVVIVLTDGETPWPPAAPKGMTVVIGLIGHEPGVAPSWARVVRIEDVA